MASREAKQLAWYSFSLAHMLHEQIKTRVKGQHLSPTQIQSLVYIHKRETTLMRDLAHWLSIAPPSATVLIEGLIRLGLVCRKRNKDDRRAWYLKLTPQGEKLLRDRFDLIAENLHRVTLVLNQKERQEFIRLLKKIVTTQKESE